MEDEDIVSSYDGGISDAYQVDDLIDWWNEVHTPELKIWNRCLPYGDYCEKMRNRSDDRNVNGVRRARTWLIHPELYNWQAKIRTMGQVEAEGQPIYEG